MVGILRLRGESGGPGRLLGGGLAGADIGGPHGPHCNLSYSNPWPKAREAGEENWPAPGGLFYLAGRTPPTITTSRQRRRARRASSIGPQSFLLRPRRQCIRSVRDHPQAMHGLADPPRVIAQVQRIQRVFRVAPRAEAVNVLMGEGVHSAFRIIRMPAEVFVDRFREKLGGEVAMTVYAAARSVTAAIAAIAWTARLRSAGPMPAAVGTWPPPPLQVADVELASLLEPRRPST